MESTELKIRCDDFFKSLENAPIVPMEEIINEFEDLESTHEDGTDNTSDNSDDSNVNFEFDLGCGIFEERSLLDELTENKDTNETNQFIKNILAAMSKDSQLIDN